MKNGEMGNRRSMCAPVRVALVAALVLGCGAASAATRAGTPPKVTKIHAVSQPSSRAPSWIVTATAVDRDRDLGGGRVTIRVGSSGKAISRKIAVGKSLAPKVPTLATTGISSALLVGKTLRVGLSIKGPPGVVKVAFSV